MKFKTDSYSKKNLLLVSNRFLAREKVFLKLELSGPDLFTSFVLGVCEHLCSSSNSSMENNS